ncbi:MAG: glycosyltransferase family 2 protein [Candidatus Saccharimonadales bacterium]
MTNVSKSSSKKALALSIVIPVCNEENHLKACLQSIASQTVQPTEVIVVDNNSQDCSVQIAAQFPFVRVISEAKQGVFYARNTGFDAVKTPLIGRIDADTILPPDWVQRVQGFYAPTANRQMALTGGCSFYNIRCPRVNRWLVSQFVFRMNRFLMGYYVLWGSNMALPRPLWRQVRSQVCDKQDIHEDLDLAMHLHKLGYGINYQAELLVAVRMRRVLSDRRQLWPYLRMWPRTLRHHGILSWPLSLLGSLFLYVMQVVPRAAERLARMSGRPPYGG